MSRFRARQPSMLGLAATLAFWLPLVHLIPSSIAEVGGPCGGWLRGTDGWDCQRLAANYQVYWRSGNGTIQMGLEIQPDSTEGVDTVDWFGIGISEAGGMPGADIALMLRDASAAAGWTLVDMFATGFYFPALDVQQDKKLLSVEESSQHRVRALISFPLESCDTQQDRAILPGIPSYVIFAFGQGPFGYHGTVNRGNVNLLLAPAPATPAPPPPPGVQAQSTKPSKPKSMTLHMPSITIPTNDTNPYVCMDFKLQGSAANPYHIIEFVSVINSTVPLGSTQSLFVHHTVLYNCTGRPSTFGQGPYACPGTPVNCSTFVLVGGSRAGKDTATTLPAEAGIRMGAGAMQYVSLQVHYYNPALEEGVVDSSGLKVTYTSKLRPNDAGLLTTGMQHFSIPPHSTWSTGPLVCPPSCTARMQQPVHMVRTLLHMHKIGTQMSLRHFTNCTNSTGVVVNASQWAEAPLLARRQYYDFSFQTFDVIAPAAASFSPADALVTTCTYFNPTNETVKYGLRSSDEMCFAFTLYWPQQELTYCLSNAEFSQLGLVLCLGMGDDQAAAALTRALKDPAATQAQVQAAIMEGMSAGILVPRESGPQDFTARSMWVQQQPASCS